MDRRESGVEQSNTQCLAETTARGHSSRHCCEVTSLYTDTYTQTHPLDRWNFHRPVIQNNVGSAVSIIPIAGVLSDRSLLFSSLCCLTLQDYSVIHFFRYIPILSSRMCGWFICKCIHLQSSALILRIHYIKRSCFCEISGNQVIASVLVEETHHWINVITTSDHEPYE